MSAFTREMLVKALEAKRIYVIPLAESFVIADAITIHDLSSVIAGRHDGKPVTFARGFELCFGERLTLKRAS